MKDWDNVDEKAITWKAAPGDAEPDATIFRLRARLVSKGSTEEPLATADDLWLKIKVYAEGGENKVHMHPNQDHAFIVLHGKARFYNKEDDFRELNPNEGIMLPAGRHYKFASCGDVPLVVLRAGARRAGLHSDMRTQEGGPVTVRRLREGTYISPDVQYTDEYYDYGC
jgi:mannose-6-phosphate isomerase-like protein (cupin superfamily)